MPTASGAKSGTGVVAVPFMVGSADSLEWREAFWAEDMDLELVILFARLEKGHEILVTKFIRSRKSLEVSAFLFQRRVRTSWELQQKMHRVSVASCDVRAQLSIKIFCEVSKEMSGYTDDHMLV